MNGTPWILENKSFQELGMVIKIEKVERAQEMRRAEKERDRNSVVLKSKNDSVVFENENDMFYGTNFESYK